MKTNEEYRMLEQKLYDCENEVALADLKVRKLDARIAELEQQNLALAAAIEARNNVLDHWLWETVNDRIKHADMRKMTQDVLRSDPSPDLLAKRDQKRDAALLREVSRLIIITNDVFNKVRSLAAAREAGEWKPDLEVKP